MCLKIVNKWIITYLTNNNENQIIKIMEKISDFTAGIVGRQVQMF